MVYLSNHQKLEEEMLKSEKVSKDLELVLEQERELRKTAEAEVSKRSSENCDFQAKIGALEDEVKRSALKVLIHGHFILILMEIRPGTGLTKAVSIYIHISCQ